MIRAQCIRCGLPTEVAHPEEVTNTPCPECSGRLAAVWAPPESPQPTPAIGRGRFRRDPERAPLPARY